MNYRTGLLKAAVEMAEKWKGRAEAAESAAADLAVKLGEAEAEVERLRSHGAYTKQVEANRKLQTERDEWKRQAEMDTASMGRAEMRAHDLQGRVTQLEADVDSEAGDLSRKIVRDVAEALGQDDGETTHDLGEKVGRLVEALSVLVDFGWPNLAAKIEHRHYAQARAAIKKGA